MPLLSRISSLAIRAREAGDVTITSAITDAAGSAGAAVAPTAFSAPSLQRQLAVTYVTEPLHVRDTGGVEPYGHAHPTSRAERDDFGAIAVHRGRQGDRAAAFFRLSDPVLLGGGP